MRTAPKIVLVLAVLVAAIGGTLLLLRSSEPADSGGASKDPIEARTDETGGPAVTSDVWAVGDAWTVTVAQDSGAITPDGTKSVAKVPYRFEVVAAPKEAGGAWKLHVTQDGAEGPFANGWRLEYVEVSGAMVLHRVAVGNEPALEAELASIVLGPQFPYEVRYSAPPKDATVDGEKLLDRSELPPGSLPGASGSSGAAPPAEAAGSGAPTTAPPA